MNKHTFTQESERINGNIRKLKINQLEEKEKQENWKLKTEKNNTLIASKNFEISGINLQDVGVRFNIAQEKLSQNEDELKNQQALSILYRENKLLAANKQTALNQKLARELEDLKQETNLALGKLS